MGYWIFLFNKIKHTIKACELKKIKAWMKCGKYSSICLVKINMYFIIASGIFVSLTPISYI